MSDFRCQFCKGSLMKVHYPKFYNMAHLFSLNIFTASKGSNNYILFKRTYFKTVDRSKVSNFTEKWKNQLNFQNSVILSNFDRKSSKFDHVIFFSAPNQLTKYEDSSSNIFFRYFAHIFFFLSKGHYYKRA